MKGAIGNAFLLNIVITFMLIFFSLLIGGMAFTKAYKVKNHIINSIDKYYNEYNNSLRYSYSKDGKSRTQRTFLPAEWNDIVNPYLGEVGYHLKSANVCPSQSFYDRIGKGDYDYCLYHRESCSDIDCKERYLVLAYMKLDLPVIGDSIKIPITGETKTYTFYAK